MIPRVQVTHSVVARETTNKSCPYLFCSSSLMTLHIKSNFCRAASKRSSVFSISNNCWRVLPSSFPNACPDAPCSTSRQFPASQSNDGSTVGPTKARRTQRHRPANRRRKRVGNVVGRVRLRANEANGADAAVPLWVCGGGRGGNTAHIVLIDEQCERSCIGEEPLLHGRRHRRLLSAQASGRPCTESGHPAFRCEGS